MFLANKWNIKEVLLFPAMKPTDDAMANIEKMNKLKLSGTSSSNNNGREFPTGVPSQSVTVLDRTCDISTADGMTTLGKLLAGKTYLQGTTPSQEDNKLHSILECLPYNVLSYDQNVMQWFSNVNQFSISVRASW
jgi:hypothetical protein